MDSLYHSYSYLNQCNSISYNKHFTQTYVGQISKKCPQNPKLRSPLNCKDELKTHSTPSPTSITTHETTHTCQNSSNNVDDGMYYKA